MKAANVPVGFLRTIEQAFNAPEVRERHRRQPDPASDRRHGAQYRNAAPLGGTPVVDPVAAPLLGEHTRAVLHKTLGYDEARIAALAKAGAFGKTFGS